MRPIVPRLKNLLRILAGNKEPRPVTDMAKQLGVSRRTVFRELENIDSVLAPYDMTLTSVPGEGILLEGGEDGRRRLERALSEAEDDEPADRGERRQLLTLALVRTPGEKLLVHAERFKVSMATISNDLDELEPRLAAHRLALVRKGGAGIFIVGSERDIRRLIVGMMHQRYHDGKPLLDYPSREIVLDIEDLREEMEPLLSWITPPSRRAFEFYLMVMVQRLKDGYSLTESVPDAAEYADLADGICSICRECFNIEPGENELREVAIQLAAARRIDGAGVQMLPRDGNLVGIAYHMIERFDPARSHLLKLDDLLVDGLAGHLRSAMVRIENHIELPDPLFVPMLRSYPETMAASRRAADMLHEFGALPCESEISLLAAHFGAAVLRLTERGMKKRALHIGVVCIHGIGTSYLLASQTRKLFGNEAEIEVGWWGDREGWRRFDFLVSTAVLKDVDLPVVVVNPVLDEEGIARIREAIRRHGGIARESFPAPRDTRFADDCREIAELAGDCAAIASGFVLERAPAASAFSGLADLAGHCFGSTGEEQQQIRDGLLAREKLATQVLPELGLVLLHCRTAGVSDPVVAVFTPEDGFFTHATLAPSRAALLMLMPENPSRGRSELMGGISAALLDDEGFLESVLAGDEEGVQRHLHTLMQNFLMNFFGQRVKR